MSHRPLFNRSRRPWGRSRQSGSTFLIVLSILSLLIIAAATLSYTTNLEARASANFGDAIQARSAALSGLPNFRSVFAEASEPAVSYAQRWATGPLASFSGQATRINPDRSTPPHGESGATASKGPDLEWAHSLQSIIEVEDDGGKLSLNALAAKPRDPNDLSPAARFDRNDLARTLREVVKNREIEGVDPETLATSIVQHIYGQDGEFAAHGEFARPASGVAKAAAAPAAGVSQSREVAAAPLRGNASQNTPGPNEGIKPAAGEPSRREVTDTAQREIAEVLLDSDPRHPLRGDDRLLISIDQLAGMAGMPTQPEAARRAVRELSRVLTVYSQSRLNYLAAGALENCLDPNTAGPEEIFEALKKVYPDLSENLIKHFAVNVVDWRDEDHTPTPYPGEDEADPILGYELAPVINEVWPDSVTRTEDGDDGQYFEIYNPGDKAISIDGWNVAIGEGAQRIALIGSLEPQGFLVVTDDRDESTDGTPEDDEPGVGSFYDIFGILGSGGTQRLMAVPTLDLPDGTETLYLYDGDNRLIDTFHYEGMRNNGVKTSAQRGDPRLHEVNADRCTPMALNSANKPRGEVRPSDPALRDKPFESVAGLFTVFTGYHDAGAKAAIKFPDYASLGLKAEGADEEKAAVATLDARLFDIFAILEPREKGLVKVASESIEDDPREEIGSAGAGRRGATRTAASREADRRNADRPTNAGRSGFGAAASAADNAPALPGDVRTVETAALELGKPLLADGRINLNTAPPAALLALPGMTEEMTQRIVAWRAQCMGVVEGAATPAIPAPRESVQSAAVATPQAAAKSPTPSPTSTPKTPAEPGHPDGAAGDAVPPAPAKRTPFASLSAFLTNEEIWTGTTEIDRLNLFRRFANLVTVDSQVFTVVGQNRQPEESGQTRPSLSKWKATVVLGANRPGILQWRYTE